jgi:spermidine synthase
MRGARTTRWRAARAAALCSLALGACSKEQVAEEKAPVVDAAPVAAPASEVLPAPAEPRKVRGAKVLEEATSPFSKVRVRQVGSTRTIGFVRERGDEMVQTMLDLAKPDVPGLKYIGTLCAPLLAVPRPQRVLVLGLGGGGLIRVLHARLPETKIDAVEIDPEVVRLAAKWFGVVPGPRLQVFTDDAAKFVARAGEAYDIIWVDAYFDPAAPGTDDAGVPEEMRGKSFLEQLKARLKPGGVAAFNVHYLSGYRAHVDAIAAVFPRVVVASHQKSNELAVLAFAGDAAPEKEALLARARALEADGEWQVPFVMLAESASPWVVTPPP